MNLYRILYKRLRLHLLISICTLTLFMNNCAPDKKAAKEKNVSNKSLAIIEIVTENMDFQTLDTILSGWNTFLYMNNSEETHFFLLDKYPAGKNIKDMEKEVGPIFQKGMDLIHVGKSEEGFEEFNKLPPWFFEIVFSGGSGLVSPGQHSETTLELEPGYYIIECYVKMENGTFHSSMGMTKELIVKDKNTGNIPLNPDVTISLSSEKGIVILDTIQSGKQIIKVEFKDQIVHENFVGHDINLVKLNENAKLEDLEKWMNWADPKGLITPAPNNIIFLGGVNDLPAGRTGFFTVNLNPGNYAIISEVPNASDKNLLKTFVIEE